jgi:hypothetical protein
MAPGNSRAAVNSEFSSMFGTLIVITPDDFSLH